MSEIDRLARLLAQNLKTNENITVQRDSISFNNDRLAQSERSERSRVHREERRYKKPPEGFVSYVGVWEIPVKSSFDVGEDYLLSASNSPEAVDGLIETDIFVRFYDRQLLFLTEGGWFSPGTIRASKWRRAVYDEGDDFPDNINIEYDESDYVLGFNFFNNTTIAEAHYDRFGIVGTGVAKFRVTATVSAGEPDSTYGNSSSGVYNLTQAFVGAGETFDRTETTTTAYPGVVDTAGMEVVQKRTFTEGSVDYETRIMSASHEWTIAARYSVLIAWNRFGRLIYPSDFTYSTNIVEPVVPTSAYFIPNWQGNQAAAQFYYTSWYSVYDPITSSVKEAYYPEIGKTGDPTWSFAREVISWTSDPDSETCTCLSDYVILTGQMVFTLKTVYKSFTVNYYNPGENSATIDVPIGRADFTISGNGVFDSTVTVSDLWIADPINIVSAFSYSDQRGWVVWLKMIEGRFTYLIGFEGRGTSVKSRKIYAKEEKISSTYYGYADDKNDKNLTLSDLLNNIETDLTVGDLSVLKLVNLDLSTDELIVFSDFRENEKNILLSFQSRNEIGTKDNYVKNTTFSPSADAIELIPYPLLETLPDGSDLSFIDKSYLLSTISLWQEVTGKGKHKIEIPYFTNWTPPPDPETRPIYSKYSRVLLKLNDEDYTESDFIALSATDLPPPGGKWLALRDGRIDPVGYLNENPFYGFSYQGEWEQGLFEIGEWIVDTLYPKGSKVSKRRFREVVYYVALVETNAEPTVNSVDWFEIGRIIVSYIEENGVTNLYMSKRKLDSPLFLSQIPPSEDDSNWNRIWDGRINELVEIKDKGEWIVDTLYPKGSKVSVTPEDPEEEVVHYVALVETNAEPTVDSVDWFEMGSFERVATPESFRSIFLCFAYAKG